MKKNVQSFIAIVLLFGSANVVGAQKTSSWSQPIGASPIVAGPTDSSATEASRPALSTSRGYAGDLMTWNIRQPDGSVAPVSIQNSSVGGLPLKPSSSSPVNWYNVANNFSYEAITIQQYQTFDQPGRKAVLYGRLLHFGSYYAAQETNLDTSAIRQAMARDAQTELAVATFARARADRRTNATLWGGIGMVLGAALAYNGALSFKCTDDYNEGRTVCEHDPIMPLVTTGGLLFLGSTLYTFFQFNSLSSQENAALATIRSQASGARN